MSEKNSFVATLMAGVVGTEYYGLDAKGKVFIVDAEGKAYEISEPLAAKVRAAINQGDELQKKILGKSQ
jgi:hypothetical protein